MSQSPPGGFDARTQFAAERTLLAWIRTGLALMGFGFVVARFGLFLRELAATQHTTPLHSSGMSFWIGVLLIILGVGVMLAAASGHSRVIRRLQEGSLDRFRVSPLGIAVTLALAAIGLGLTIYFVVTVP
ncbi:hypothetical protein Pan44_24960 [Caulifigura coniformis]|uniref:DUF202 domain-containing protein n=1 Tax=Caulifigura coniformis TaxID=2527983 RepID=A0A517SEA7_9PLAN|nr:DUF202 domain-containing protein [Caulifigura coniformis]QDT54463.1 hypothetical protein Pan44_24960 [Caulifigura coniformis]